MGNTGCKIYCGEQLKFPSLCNLGHITDRLCYGSDKIERVHYITVDVLSLPLNVTRNLPVVPNVPSITPTSPENTKKTINIKHH